MDELQAIEFKKISKSDKKQIKAGLIDAGIGLGIGVLVVGGRTLIKSMTKAKKYQYLREKYPLNIDTLLKHVNNTAVRESREGVSDLIVIQYLEKIKDLIKLYKTAESEDDIVFALNWLNKLSTLKDIDENITVIMLCDCMM